MLRVRPKRGVWISRLTCDEKRRDQFSPLVYQARIGHEDDLSSYCSSFNLFALPSKILVVAKRDLLLPLKLSRLAVLASGAISLWLGRKASKRQSFHQ